MQWLLLRLAAPSFWEALYNGHEKQDLGPSRPVSYLHSYLQPWTFAFLQPYDMMVQYI